MGNIKESFWGGVKNSLPEVAVKSIAVGAVADVAVQDMSEYGMAFKLIGVSIPAGGIGLVDYYLIKRIRNRIMNLQGEKKLVDQTMSTLIAINPVASTAILNNNFMSPIEKGVAFFGLVLTNALVLGISDRIAELQDARHIRSSR